MTQSNTLNNKQDASSKWSGYNYQGKVALYVVLYLINNPKDLGKKTNDTWDNYSLEIEGLEDFSILKNEEYISIHQVKAYTSSNYVSNFKNALWGLIGKTIENESIIKSCLHTLDKVDELNENNINNIDKIKKLEATNDLEKGFREKYFDKCSLLEIAFEKLAFYNNHNAYKLHIGLDEINDFIIKELKKYYEANYEEDYKTEKEYLNAVFNKLLFIMDRYIYKRHKKELTQVDYLSFKEIKKCIDDNVDPATHEYFIYELRKIIGEEVYDFCYECICEGNNECKNCNLMKYKEEGIWKENEEFIHFLRNINIHIIFDRNNIKFEDAFQIGKYIIGYKAILARIYDYDYYPGIEKNQIAYEKENHKYISTAISHLEVLRKRRNNEKRGISQNIIENLEKDTQLLKDLHGVNGFISHDVSINSIKELANPIGKKNLSESDETFKTLKEQYDWGVKIIDDLSIIKWDDILED